MNNHSKRKWSSTLAYAVGLITTDGNLSKDKRHILFTTTDRQLSSLFKKCLALKSKVMVTPLSGFGKRIAYRINFSDVAFYNQLQKMGPRADKSHHQDKLCIPKEYFVDFLRGYLDGDGSVFTYKDAYAIYKGKRYINNRLYTNFVSCNREQIRWIKSKIKEAINIEGSLTSYNKKDRKMPIWQLRYAKNDSLKLLPWIYYESNLPCLTRKRQIAERFLPHLSAN